ncbi:MAG TPA: hypothetical protein EYQ63_03495 [Fuerstia sp.]|nr:hypothetical protein [Fuerstiella sp.]
MRTTPSSAAAKPDVASTQIAAANHLDIEFCGRIIEPFAEGNAQLHVFIPLAENEFSGDAMSALPHATQIPAFQKLLT